MGGGVITNTGSITGLGTVGNNVNNDGTVEALGGTLNLNGTVSNNSGGLMRATSGNKILVTNGMASNAGIVSLAGGILDNNGNAMSNSGQITGFGILSTGGLTNNNNMTLTGGTTTVNGNVINSASGNIEVAYDSAIFTGDFINNGTFKTTDTVVTFTGTYTENGTYISDPSTQYFTDLISSETGSLIGGVGDNFLVSGDFINNSTQNTTWGTTEAYLGFTTGSDNTHGLHLAGYDYGAFYSGFDDNFAWGTLSLDIGHELNLFDGNGVSGGAMYVSEFNLGGGTDQIDSIFSHGYNIYYDANAAGNNYLGGFTYDLDGGGVLAAMQAEPVPEPATIALLGIGLGGMYLRRRKRRVK